MNLPIFSIPSSKNMPEPWGSGNMEKGFFSKRDKMQGRENKLIPLAFCLVCLLHKNCHVITSSPKTHPPTHKRRNDILHGSSGMDGAPNIVNNSIYLSENLNILNQNLQPYADSAKWQTQLSCAFSLPVYVLKVILSIIP